MNDQGLFTGFVSAAGASTLVINGGTFLGDHPVDVFAQDTPAAGLNRVFPGRKGTEAKTAFTIAWGFRVKPAGHQSPVQWTTSPKGIDLRVAKRLGVRIHNPAFGEPIEFHLESGGIIKNNGTSHRLKIGRAGLVGGSCLTCSSCCLRKSPFPIPSGKRYASGAISKKGRLNVGF